MTLTERLEKLNDLQRDLRRYERRNAKRYGERMQWPHGVRDVYWRMRKKVERLRGAESGDT